MESGTQSPWRTGRIGRKTTIVPVERKRRGSIVTLSLLPASRLTFIRKRERQLITHSIRLRDHARTTRQLIDIARYELENSMALKWTLARIIIGESIVSRWTRDQCDSIRRKEKWIVHALVVKLRAAAQVEHIR